MIRDVSGEIAMITGWSLVDKDGKALCSHVPRSTAESMHMFYAGTNPAYGRSLEIKPSEPKPIAPPITFPPEAWAPAEAPKPPKLPEIESGHERAHLRDCIERCKTCTEDLGAAKKAAERARNHLAECESEVARLRAADEAETAAAGAQLADRLKSGLSAPLEPNLCTGRAAVLASEARRDAAMGACSLLDSDATAAEQAVETAFHNAKLAADVVIRAEMQQRIEQLEALWKQITPLRQLIDDARCCGAAIDIPAARAALVVPDLQWNGNKGNYARLRNYREALRRDAEAQFEDQPAEVKQ